MNKILKQIDKKLLSFLTLFGFAGIILKLTGIVDWSWKLTLSPFMVVPSIFLFAICAGLIVKSIKVIIK